jgi:ATP-binding cassette subfamily F protein 3
MISLTGVTVSFGSFNLLDCIDLHISESDKIGLVGKNGAGKSTLMKLITGEQQPTSGVVSVPAGLSLGYLPQIMEHHRGHSVMDEVLTVFDHIHDMEAELERLTAKLGERTDYESEEYASIIDRMNDLSDRLALESGESPRVQALRVLKGLGFKEEELDRNTETFSQGWNMRMELAKILLGKPDVLLLDEPTNHLDIESIQWFEDYLKAFRGSVLLVSHDRRFLDNVTGRTVEIMLGHIHDYKVPYSKYVELRAERLAQQTAAYENQQRMIQKTEDFINRFRYKPTKSNQVQSRIKALEKLDRIEIDQTENARINIKFPPAPRSGDVVFKSKSLKAGYPGKVVFSGADIEIKRGEKVALVGRNGEGKTTLVRILTGMLEPLEGEARIGHNVSIGYYAQNQEDVLDGNLTVFDTLDRVAVGEVRTRLKDILGAFLFKGEDIDKKVSVLSGGERARLGMAQLMLSPYNLLVLDEPTNHMDILSKDRLKQALQKYDGTLIAVSHDRDFLEGLADKIYEFRDGHIREHLGGVSHFLEKLRIESLQELETAVPAKEEPGKEKNSDAAERFNRQKAVSREERKLRNRISFLEKEIAQKEGKMKNIEKILANPGKSDDIYELTSEYLELKLGLDSQTDEWTSLMEQLDN